jgi:uncharacterized NAD(P)/FAD-binding protein YdhS
LVKPLGCDWQLLYVMQTNAARRFRLPLLDPLKSWLNRLWRDEHSARARQLAQDVEKAFTEHPEMTGETYLQHLWFTSKMAGRFAYTSFVIVVHGLFPFIFVKTASTQIEQIYRIMKSRIPQQRREEIDREPPRIRIAGKPDETRIAIVGGGFCGAMAFVNLIKQSHGPYIIDWYEPRDSLGTGIAYSTSLSSHRLNVRADRMGALANQPDHFWQWIQSEAGQAKIAAIWPEGGEIKPDSFVPRPLYGAYLRDVVAESLRDAKRKEIKVTIHHSTVTDAKPTSDGSSRLLLLAEEKKQKIEVLTDALILATGNLPPRSHGFTRGLLTGKENYIDDVWNPLPDGLYPHRVGELSADAEIVIIGTGLTMVDTVLTLRQFGYKGTVTAISRHGLLPAAHATGNVSYPAWEWVVEPQYASRTALGLLKGLRAEIAKAEAQGISWHAVIDSLRPVTQILWKSLPLAEKRKFMARLLTLWNVHRHRMAPEIFQEIRTAQQSGALKIIPGRIYYVGSDKDGVTVAYRRRGTNRVETLRPALVLNCTGPDYDIATSDHALLKNLRDRELITVGPLRAGIEVSAIGTAKNKLSSAIYPLGMLMVGELLETTAVPELREQAARTAKSVLDRLRSGAHHSWEI